MDLNSRKKRDSENSQSSSRQKKAKNEKENEPLPTSNIRPKTKYSFIPENSKPLNPLVSIKIDPDRPSSLKERIPLPKRSPVTNHLSSDDDRVVWEETPRQIKRAVIDSALASPSNATNIPGGPFLPSSPLSVIKSTPSNGLGGKYQIEFANLGSQKSPSKELESESLELELPKPKAVHRSKLIPKRQLQGATPFKDKNLKNTKTPSATKKNSGFSDLLGSVLSSCSSSGIPDRSNLSSFNDFDETPIKAAFAVPNLIKSETTASGSGSSGSGSGIRSGSGSGSGSSSLKVGKANEEDTSDSSLLSDDSGFASLFAPDHIPLSQYIRNAKKNSSVDSMQPKTDGYTANILQLKAPVSLKPVETAEAPAEPKIQPKELSDFEFSDDDDDFKELLDRKESQKPKALRIKISQTETQTQISGSLALNTQQRNIKEADKHGHLVFKKDIDDSQTDAFQYKEEDVNKAKSAVARKSVQRFEILKVLDNFYYKDKVKKVQKVITVRDHEAKESRVIIRGMSSALEFQEGDVLHIVGENFRMVDDETDNLLIWNPDILLSATLIADTINCTRRSVLKQKVEFNGEYSVPLIVGEVVHHVFQGVLARGECTMNLMKSLMNEAIAGHHLTILIIQQLESEVRAQCELHLPYIKTWYDSYYKEVPDYRSMISINKTNKKVQFSSSNILDVEESVISHAYGLRGFIDVSIEAHIKTLTEDSKLVVPLELKSGARSDVSHEAQASFYTLMMRDRYEMNVEFFMLVYTKLAQTTINQVTTRDVKHLVALRNKLSQFMKDGTRELPPLIKQDKCVVCYSKHECMAYYKLMEDGKEEDDVLPAGMFDELTGHLNERHKEFFNYWDDLITKEESVSKIVSKELFLVDSTTREKAGKCIGHLVIESYTDDSKPGSDQKRFLYTFKRAPGDPTGPIGATQLSKSDKVQISDENGNFSLATGWIVAITSDTVQLTTSKRLTTLKVKLENFDAKNNQRFQTHLKPLTADRETVQSQAVHYRIDKDDMFHFMKTARSNVLNLFLKEGDEQRRRLIVDQEPPKFASAPLPYSAPPNKFNEDQMAAFDKVLTAEDYALILGMPGTGKTTVIAQLIKFLVANGKTVLLTSYTHSAVDNILIKMQNEDFDILRLGSSLSRIHPDVHKFSPLTKDIKASADLDQYYFKPPVVATTCLSINDWIFNRRRFDYCIVDESSQVSMPVCLGPLKFCEKFVLVGDHYQLPPLIQNPNAKGLSKSLFKMLSEQSPESVVDLTYQYRMCEDIMLLTNTIIYEGRLKCGSEAVATQSLDVPEISKLQGHLRDQNLPQDKRWLTDVLDPKRKVLFLNHDEVGDCHETKYKENIENVKEAELIRQIAEAFLSCGVGESSIGIMSFYRAQLRRLHRVLADHPNIEKLTADQFQGRDKDCIIISLVKANDMNDAGSLLREWRRVNVAITRARSKLIIIGSKKTLKSLETMGAFLNILDTRGWSYDLPFQADKMFRFGEDEPAETEIKMGLSRSVKDLKIVEKRALLKEVVEEAVDENGI